MCRECKNGRHLSGTLLEPQVCLLPSHPGGSQMTSGTPRCHGRETVPAYATKASSFHVESEYAHNYVLDLKGALEILGENKLE